MKKTILIVEDDEEINRMLRILLEKNGYTALSAYSGTEAVLVHGEAVDLILLDMMLPGKSGDEILSELKQKKNVPVIVVSAAADIDKKVDMFSLGADDYITKPFHNAELLARIEARLRTGTAADNSVRKLTYKNIELDPVGFRVKCAGREA